MSGNRFTLAPGDWQKPRGYTDGVVASGRVVFLAGQIGWNPASAQFESDDLVQQVRQALDNIVVLLREAGSAPEDLVRLTWYITDRNEYLRARSAIGAVYRDIIGKHYPPMAVVFVDSLVEASAKVEIEATAVIPA